MKNTLLTEFHLLQIKSQLEICLESMGSQHKETLKLQLQYSNMLCKFSKQKGISLPLLDQAFQLLLPTNPPDLLLIQPQYWKILIKVAVNYSQGLTQNEQSQKAIHILLQVQNLYQSRKIEFTVEMEFIYFHLSILWFNEGKVQRAFQLSNDCIQFIKERLQQENINLKKMLSMLAEMYILQTKVKQNSQFQLNCYNQIYNAYQKYNQKGSEKYLALINQAKASIDFEKEIDILTKQDFKKQMKKTQSQQINFFGSEMDSVINDFMTNKTESIKRQHKASTIEVEQIQKKHTKQRSDCFQKKMKSEPLVLRRVITPSPKLIQDHSHERKNLPTQDDFQNFYFLAGKDKLLRNSQRPSSSMRANTNITTTVGKGSHFVSHRFLTISSKFDSKRVSPNILETLPPESLNTSQVDILKKQNYMSLLVNRPQITQDVIKQRVQKQMNMDVKEKQKTPEKDKKNLKMKKSLIMLSSGMRKSNKDIPIKKHQKIEFPKTNILPPELSNRSFSNHSNQGKQTNIDGPQDRLNEEQNKAALIIQRCFRRKKIRDIKKQIDKEYGQSDYFSQVDQSDLESQYSMSPLRQDNTQSNFKRSQTVLPDPLDLNPKLQSQGKIELPSSLQSQKGPRRTTIKKFTRQFNRRTSQILRDKLNIKQTYYHIREESSEDDLSKKLEIISLNFSFNIAYIKQKTLSILRLDLIRIEQRFFVKVNIKYANIYTTIILQDIIEKKKYKERKKSPFLNFMIDVLSPLKLDTFDSLILINENHEQTNQNLELIQIILQQGVDLFLKKQINGYRLNKLQTQLYENRMKIKAFRNNRKQQVLRLVTKIIHGRAQYLSKIIEAQPVIETQVSNKLRTAAKAVLFTVKAKKHNNEPPKPPVIPLMLYEQEMSMKNIEYSMHDSDFNRIKLRSIMNGPNSRRISQNLDNEVSTYLKTQQASLKRSSQIKFGKQKKIQSPQSNTSLFKKTQTIEQPSIFQFGEPKLQRMNAQYLQNVQYEEETPQGVITSIRIPEEDKLKTSIQVGQDNPMISQNQNSRKQSLFTEEEMKMQTLYKKSNHIEVSKEWSQVKRQHTSSIHKNNIIYFEPIQITEIKFQNCYINPFDQETIVFNQLIKMDTTFLIITIKQILKQVPQHFNWAFINTKKNVVIQIQLSEIKQIKDPWIDQIQIKFKDFITWFVQDFDLQQYVFKMGFNKDQKFEIYNSFNRFIKIVNGKIKLSYFQVNKQKQKRPSKKLERQSIFVERAQIMVEMIQRDSLKEDFQKKIRAEQFFKLLDNQFMKLERRRSRLNNRMFNQTESIIQLPKEDQTQIFDQVDSCLEKTINVPKNLENNLLTFYNTVNQLHSDQIKLIRYKDQYFIYKSNKLMIWRPFKQICWKTVQIDDINKLITLIQSNYKSVYLNYGIKNKKKLIGYEQKIQKQQDSFKYLDKNSQFLYDNIHTQRDRLQFISIIQNTLIAQDDNWFWKTYFSIQQKTFYATIKGLEKGLIDIQIYQDNFQKINKKSENMTLVKVKIYPFNSSKTNYQVVVFSTFDLLFILDRLHMEYNQLSQDQFFFVIHKIMSQCIQFQRGYLNKKVYLVLQNKITNQYIKLNQQIPWLSQYTYEINDKMDMKFFHYNPKQPKILCNSIIYIQLPSKIRSLSLGRYQSFSSTNINYSDMKLKRLPCCVTIMKSSKIDSILVKLYFPQNQRTFISQIRIDEIVVKNWKQYHYSVQTGQQFLKILLSKYSSQYWIRMIQSFRVSINDQKKFLLVIDDFSTKSILQEQIYMKVKKLQSQNQLILFNLNMETKKQDDPEYLTVHQNFPQIRIMEASHYTLYMKLQWLQGNKIQSQRLPLQELMVSYYSNYIKGGNIFNYCFRQIDIQRLCSITVENIITKWAQNQQFDITENGELHPNKSLKLNQGIKETVQFEKRLFIQLYRGVLMRNPQTFVGIFHRHDREILYFHIQRLIDCQSFVYKIKYPEIENLIPGFLFRINQQGFGQNIFSLFKNRLILQCYYYLS
ncbi:hypothetical protein pb186bvf_000510 [Paramecium bursaria]